MKVVERANGGDRPAGNRHGRLGGAPDWPSKPPGRKARRPTEPNLLWRVLDWRLFQQPLRALISDLHPDSTEVPKPGEPSAAYGYGEKKISEAYAYIMPQKAYANIGFYHGVSIVSSGSLLGGTDKTFRHIKVHTVEMVQSDAIQAVLLSAMEERRTALGL